jgi:ABC-type antimicrobial peptide transport system permease subunit
MDTLVRGASNVLRNPLRLLLIVFILGASLMLVAAMVSLSGSVQQQLSNVQKQVGTSISITYATNAGAKPDKIIPLPNSALATAQHTAGVASVEARLSRRDANGALKGNPIQGPDGKSFSPAPTIEGISPGATHFTLAGGATPELISGRNFQAGDATANVAMMSQALAQANNLSVGSTFALHGTTFTIIGLYTTGQTFADDSLVMPLATMQRVFAINGVDSITAYAQSYDQVETVAARMRAVLGKAYNIVTEASNYTDTMNTLKAVQNSITLALLIAILTATLITIFTVVISVRERTREIGILKALGASHWQVIRQFWGEVLVLSAVAALLAVTLLVTVGPLISQSFTVPTGANNAPGSLDNGVMLSSSLSASSAVSTTHLSAATLDARTLLLIVGLSMGLAVLTSVIPAWYVARIKPAEVLRRA